MLAFHRLKKEKVFKNKENCEEIKKVLYLLKQNGPSFLDKVKNMFFGKGFQR